MDLLLNYSPVLLALLAGLFTWFITALGASMVFFFKDINLKVLNAMLGFAAGVMIAASFWSLLAPAIELAEGGTLPAYVTVSLGFLGGGFFLWLVDRILPHMHQGTGHREGIKTSWQRSVLLVLAITFHNIPEGLAVGVAFGGLASGNPAISLAGAVSLALGIGLQNFPEGAAVSIPLRRENMSCKKAFLIGQFSGMVEPIAAVIGAVAVVFIAPLLPLALAFAAGAMIYVVAEELIPESRLGHEGDIATIGLMFGFTLMMILDVSLG
ncbi:ZIP family metal transporter [Acetobacterium bakii]|uniref:Dihydroorotate dehydrogenase n=1 Tax=Acetobacterium bakii TaxID=52689 RepID=A0A0L6TWJ1_9FIRM|nr:ZIP family metal transporter [Acetobacterium bakii]KNZ40628.1 dihydroorotate dehydrogenase [Acetobacterium bakii]